MNERKLVAAACGDRKSWEVIKDHVQDLPPEAAMLVGVCSEFYAADNKAERVDIEILKARIERQIQNNKLAEVLKQIVDTLPEVSATNVTRELVEFKKHKLGMSIAGMLTAAKHGSELDKLIEQYQSYVGDTLDLSLTDVTQQVVGIDVSTLVASAFDQTKLIKFRPKQLNDKLDGGCNRGHHVIIVGRPEIGKTLVALDLAAGFLAQGLRVLWIENEEPIEDDLLRLGSRVSGMNKYEIRDNPDKAHKLIQERVGDRFIIVGLAPGTYAQIRGLTDKYKPDVVIVNQLRNIDVRSENRTQALERASLEGRSLAKSRNVLVLQITQAGDSADGKRVLEMGDIDGSNTGVQGPADVILAIGAAPDDLDRCIRWLKCVKNKRAGPASHEPMQVFIDPSISKVLEG